MKKNILKVASYSLAITLVAAAMEFAYAKSSKDDVMEKMPDGTYIVNTTTIANNIKGYKGATPLKIYIKSDKVVKIEALQNMETPRFFDRVKQAIFESWNGKKVSKAINTNVDCVAGATYSSTAVIETVKEGLKYYKNNK